MICNKCGSKTDAGTMFCGNCGNKIEQSSAAFNKSSYSEANSQNTKTFCGNCGAEMQVGAAFCGNCGASPYEQPSAADNLTRRIHVTNGTEPRTATRKKKSKAPLIILIVSLILVLASVGVWGYLWYSGAFDSSENETEYSDRKSDKDSRKDEERLLAELGEKDEDKNVEDEDDEDDDSKKEDDEKNEEEVIESEEDLGYIYPSDREYITEYDIEDLTKDEVAMLRNEIYARHGYVFQTEPYKSYFESQEWYVPNPNFNESMFNTIEKANKDFLVKYEKERGWR